MDFCGLSFGFCFAAVGGEGTKRCLGGGKVEQTPKPGRAVGEAIQFLFPCLAHSKDTLQKAGSQSSVCVCCSQLSFVSPCRALVRAYSSAQMADPWCAGVFVVGFPSLTFTTPTSARGRGRQRLSLECDGWWEPATSSPSKSLSPFATVWFRFGVC